MAGICTTDSVSYTESCMPVISATIADVNETSKCKPISVMKIKCNKEADQAFGVY